MPVWNLVCVCVQVYNVHYSMSINGKVEEGSMEIDTANNVERFSTGSGADEAMEVHDFEIVSRTGNNKKKFTINAQEKKQTHQHTDQHLDSADQCVDELRL